MEIYKKLYNEFEDKYWGYATMAMLGQTCLGSVAAMCILAKGRHLIYEIELAIVIIICMLVNVSIIAQYPKPIVFKLIIATIIINILGIALNL